MLFNNKKSVALCLGTIALAGNFATAQVNPLVSEIAPYVYPQNRQSAPKAMTYMPDGASYLELSSDGKQIVRYDVKTGKELDVFFDVARTRETAITDIEGFTLSDDASKVLVWRNTKEIYRHSFTAEYYVYEVRSRLLRPLSKQNSRQQEPIFSPDSRMVAYVADNNIYVAKLDYETTGLMRRNFQPPRQCHGHPTTSPCAIFAMTKQMCRCLHSPFTKALATPIRSTSITPDNTHTNTLWQARPTQK
jgi:hypothetical protein